MFYNAILYTGKKVKVKEISTSEEELALKALGSSASFDSAVSQKGFVQELIKMMLVEIDGKSITYADLNNLDDYFKAKEIRQLESFYNKLHVPSKDEEESFLASIAPVSTVK
jgi:hypothetical protein